mgnify:CR=1 FL=1
MTKAQIAAKLNGHVHLTVKQLVWFVAVVLPWAMTITVGVAIASYVNVEQQKTLDARAKAVEELQAVKVDIGWLKKSNRRIEQRIFGNSVIPDDRDEEGDQ